MTPLPSSQQLRYLVALADTLHVGRAAAACAVSQSTLSTGLIALERALGAAILDRSAGKRVVFTSLGQELVVRARTALAALRSVADAADAARAPLAGGLRLGIIPTIGPFLLSRLISTIRHIYPELHVALREDRSARLLANLQDGTLDMAIMAEPYPCDPAETMPIARDEFVVALPRQHFLTVRDAIPLSALAREPMLLLEDGHCLREQVLAACPTDSRIHEFAATSLHTLIHMVASGFGVALIPRLASAGGLMRDSGAVLRRLDGAGAWRTISLAWLRGSRRSAEFRLLGPAVAAAIADVTASGSS